MLVGQLAAIAVLAFLWIDGDSDISVVAAFSSCVSQFDHRQRQFASFALSTTSVRPYATRPSKRTPTFAARPTVKMLVQPGGRDALVELSTKDSTYSKTVRKTPRSFRKIASIASLPAAALTGFALTPSRRIIAHGVGGAIAGVAGVITKSRLDIETEAAAKPALAQLLLDNDLNDPNLCNLVQQLKTDYGVNDDDFMEMATDVYKRYLAAMVKHPHAKTSEIAELTTLTSVLGLDNIAVGEAHAIAAKEVYRNTCTWTPEEELDDPEHPDRMSLDKLLFLSERAFRNNRETDEAFKFEFSRVCKAFNVTGFTGLQRVANVAEPFYQRALDTTRIKLNSGAVNPDMLARARNTLGISDSVASDMHIATYAAEVKSLLGLETEGADLAACQFPKGALKRLENLRSVLQISEEDAAYEQSVEVTPIFQATVLNVMKDTTTSMSTNETDGVPDMEHMWSIVESRKNDLCLSDDAMIPLLDSVIVQTLGMHIEEAATFAAVDNESGVYSKIVQAVKVKNSVSNFLSTSPFTDVANRMETYYDMDSHNAAFAFINADVRKKIYQMFLAQSIRQDFDHEDEAGISPEMNAKLMEVRTILGVDEVSSADVTAIVCGPIVEKALRTAADEITGGDATPELFQNLKARNERLLADLKLPTDLIFKYSGEIYKNFLRFVKQNTPSGIPSSEFSEKMSALRELLNLGEKDISSMHLAMFGTTYKKSVLEAMGSTGIIVPEYRAALERLRIRLGLILVTQRSYSKLQFQKKWYR